MVIQRTVNPPPLARLVRSQDAPPNTIYAGRVRSPARSHKPLPSLVQIQDPQPVLGLEVFMDAHDTVTVEEGDRYPSGPPGIVSLV